MRRGDKFLQSKLHDDALVIDSQFKENLKKQLFAEKREIMASNQHKQLKISQLVRQRNFMYASGFAVLLVMATAIYALDNRSESLARQNIIEDTVELPQLDGVLGIDQMRVIAQDDAPEGATIISVEVENEHGAVLYKVKFSDGTFRLYDAKTGLAFIDTTDGLETDESVPANFVAGISLQQARDIASNQRVGKTITKIELETENGVVVYSVRFADGGRVDVNATDGSIVRIKGADGENVSGSDDNDSSSDDDSTSGSDSEDRDSDDSSDDSSGSSNSGSGSSNSGSSNDDSIDD